MPDIITRPVLPSRATVRVALLHLGLALLSGILFCFSLPPHHPDLELLGWVAFVPLLFAASRTPRRLYAFGLGLVAGIIAGVTYVGFDNRGLSGTSMHYAYLPFIWIAMVLGVVSMAASYARQRWPDGGFRGPLFIACAGVMAEWLTMFSPLPVGVALCQSRSWPVIQIASVTGIWGVSWLLYFMNATWAGMLFSKRKQDYQAHGFALALFVLAVGSGVGSVLSEGALQKTHFPATHPKLRVATIQDYNGSEGGVDASTYTGELPDSEALMRQAAAKGAKLIVGTENALGNAFLPTDPDDSVYALAKETQAYLVVGFESRDQPRPYNCAALVAPEGRTLGIHHKIQLFLGERQTMHPGDSATAWETGFGKVGTLICFDSCYTTYARQCALAGARLIAIPNYDPPTPQAVLHHLHAALMPFRAVEHRVALVRAEPSGLSQIIDPWGRVVSDVAPMYRSAAVTADVPLGDGKGTLYTRLGDWFAYFCAAVTAVVLLMPIFRSRKSP